MNQPTKMDAVLLLRPNAICTLSGDNIIWQDTEQTAPTDAEIQTKYDELVAAFPLNELREVRDAKLAETDWEIVMHKEKGTNIPTVLKTYRQSLRDITDTYTSLDDVVWPEKP